MPRKEFPTRIKVAAYERAGGLCEACGASLRGKRVEYDHRIPDALGGAPTAENCVCLCSACHREKTSTKDIPVIAKTKRIRAKAIGAKKPRNPIPGSKDSKWKRKLDGTVVPR